MPRLLVIIDEFATLKAELPEFIDALVGVAQRGRSLGVHMLLATQRPQGAISDNIRANTNMRIALRMQDTNDSKDVIDVPDAAAIPRTAPGRAYVRLGPGKWSPSSRRCRPARAPGRRSPPSTSPRSPTGPSPGGPPPRRRPATAAPPSAGPSMPAASPRPTCRCWSAPSARPSPAPGGRRPAARGPTRCPPTSTSTRSSTPAWPARLPATRPRSSWPWPTTPTRRRSTRWAGCRATATSSSTASGEAGRRPRSPASC